MKKIILLAVAFCLVFAGSASIASEKNTTIAERSMCHRTASQPHILAMINPVRSLHSCQPGIKCHLCSDDDHCGAGHKCCSGHCKKVVTCP